MRISALFTSLALAASMTHCASETGGKKRPHVPDNILGSALGRELVSVQAVIPDIEFEPIYATAKNVARQPLYPRNFPCLLHPNTVIKLRHAQDQLRVQGYRLKIWDAWRPPEVQLSLFDWGGHSGMFTDPRIMWSRHCSGTAVDVTLVDKHGKELRMPTGYDHLGPEAYYIYIGGDPEIRANVRILQQAMMAAGFSVLDTEWWHFDDAEFNGRAASAPVYAADLKIVLPAVKKARR